MKATAHGFEYGIKDPAMAERMEFQSSKKKFGRKRFVSNKADPTTPEAQKHIVEEKIEREELAEKVAFYEKEFNINPLSWGKRKKK